MAKKFTKVISAMLALVMCFGTVLPVFAEETEDNFNAMELEGVVSSSDEYTYMIAQDDVINYYETSNHTVTIAGAGAVHIFPIIDTTRDVENGTWEANGVYVSGESNYDVVYCCDFSTGTRVDEDDVTNTYYKRLNLEDSEYFDDIYLPCRSRDIPLLPRVPQPLSAPLPADVTEYSCFSSGRYASHPAFRENL